MIILAIIIIIFFLLFIVFAFVFAIADKGSDGKTIGVCGAPLCLTVAGLLGFFSTLTTVSAGHVGIVSYFGEVQDATLSPGIHMVNPFVSVTEMSTQTENYWMSHQEHEGSNQRDDSVMVQSSDRLQMPVDLSVPYRLSPDAAGWVYRNLGIDYVEKLLRPSLSTAARRAASGYTSQDLSATKRDEFADKIRLLLEEELSHVIQDGYAGKSPPSTVLIISPVLVGHVGMPDTVRTAIERKLKADQEQQAMDFEIMREKKEAERKQVEAQGIQTFQEIVSRGINEDLLRWKAIEATLKLSESPNSKVVIIGSGKDSLPVILNTDQK
jgi:regulator of protease activity HflC (stomatin/prohibitin superfamily)